MKKTLVYTACLALLTILGLGTLRAGGFILTGPNGSQTRTAYQLQLRSEKATVEIKDRTATTHIDQTFYNPTGSRLEGWFIFPIPKGAVIDKFTMFINGKETEAELLEAKKAKKIYEDIVRSMKDPALLEYANQGLFKVRIFPIEPNSEKRIKISYSEVLPMDNATVEYNYQMNTHKYTATPIQNFSLNVNIETQDEIKNVYCPTHETEIILKGDHKAVCGYESTGSGTLNNFKLYYNLDNQDIGMSILAHKSRSEDGYYFMSLSPGFSDDLEVAAKDVTFVLDVSGSMAGEKMKQAKKALNFCISNLNEEDCFEVIRFSTEAEPLFQGLADANESNKDKAAEYVDDLKAIGGTNIEEALTLAMENKGKGDRPHMIIFITDGKPTIGTTEEEKLVEQVRDNNKESTRIFTFGIGNEINTHLLDKITDETNAYRSYIRPDEDIEIKISDFYTKVSAPVLTDIRITFDTGNEVYKSYPRKLPDLFKGGSLTVMGRYKQAGKGRVKVSGKVNGQTKSFSYNINLPEEEDEYGFIPPLWASRCIGYLLDQIRLNGENKELVDEVTALAKKHGIITPYTSYLILEDQQQLASRPREVIIDDLEAPVLLKEEIIGFDQVEESEADALIESNKTEYFSSMREKSGEAGVRSSTEFQQLNTATNIAQTNQGADRLAYKDKSGATKNLANAYRNIQGRAVYQNGSTWVDSEVANNRSNNVNRIKYGSKEYFELYNSEPLAAEFLALGRNVNFVLRNEIYMVYD